MGALTLAPASISHTAGLAWLDGTTGLRCDKLSLLARIRHLQNFRIVSFRQTFRSGAPDVGAAEAFQGKSALVPHRAGCAGRSKLRIRSRIRSQRLSSRLRQELQSTVPPIRSDAMKSRDTRATCAWPFRGPLELNRPWIEEPCLTPLP